MKQKETETLHCTNIFQWIRFAETDSMHDMEKEGSNGIENQLKVVSTRNCLEAPKAFGSTLSNV